MANGRRVKLVRPPPVAGAAARRRSSSAHIKVSDDGRGDCHRDARRRRRRLRSRTHQRHAQRGRRVGRAVPVKLTAFYLDIGGSESLGFQPTGISGHNGERTNTGYANDLLLREGLKGVALQLQQVGCPGDTVQSMLNTTQGRRLLPAP